MAEKILRKFQQYSKNELMQFLQKNGYDEFAEILNNGDITTGEKLLNLTELQIIQWKLPPATKKKLMSFLKEVKENPQKFMGNLETEKPSTLTRRQSLRTKSDFREKLEQVITIPRSPEIKQVKKPAPSPKDEPIRPQIIKKPAAPPPQMAKDRAPSPLEDYLPMDRGKVDDLEAHYDANGYLIPVEKSQVVEENDYEPPPSGNRIITSFTSTIHREGNINISTRVPLALPRESTDGYIQGPEDLGSPDQTSSEPPVFPRIQRNQRAAAFRPKISSPASSPPSIVPKITVRQEIQKEEEEEEVDYEPIDDDDDENEPPSTSMSPEPINIDVQTGSLTRLIDFLKKGRPQHYENNDIKVKKIEKNDNRQPVATRAEQVRKITARPLPPLPPDEPSAASKPIEPKATLEEPLEEYENIHKNLSAEDLRRLHTQLSNALNLNEGFRSDKSKSENNLATAEEPLTYGNLDENNKPKYPESYEKHHYKNKPGTKLPFSLPLPPTFIPQIRLEEAICPVDNVDQEEGEGEDYGSCIFNINDEPFYRYTDRKGAKQLLSTLGDGAFLFRPSKTFFLTLSLKYHNQYHNLGIVKTDNNKIRLNTSGDNMSPEFATLTDFVEYFTKEQITFEHKGRTIETYLKKFAI